MKSNGKARNAEVLAKRFGMFASVGDMEADLANARAVLADRQRLDYTVRWNRRGRGAAWASW